MNKLKKSLNEDELYQDVLKTCIHTSLGRLLHFTRTISSLSLEQLSEKSSINSSAIWRMEKPRNYHILSYTQAMFHYLESIKCIISLHNICFQIAKALTTGKCIVINLVDSSELSNYNSHQIFLRQQSDDVKELDRRIRQREAILLISKKLCATKKNATPPKKKNVPAKKPTDKKKSKKR